MEAIVLLKDCKSHSVNLDGKSIKFINGRGLTTSDEAIIAYCQGQPDQFDVVMKETPKPEAKPKASNQDAEQDDGDTKKASSTETPAPRGKRKRVKVE